MKTLKEFAEFLKTEAYLMNFDAQAAADETIPEEKRWNLVKERYLEVASVGLMEYRQICDGQKQSRKELVEA